MLAQTDAELSDSHWKHTKTLAYVGSVVFVILVGVVAWILQQEKSDSNPESGEVDIIEWKSQMFGWGSAALYRKFHMIHPLSSMQTPRITVASRFPQIRKCCFHRILRNDSIRLRQLKIAKPTALDSPLHYSYTPSQVISHMSHRS